MNAVPSWIFLKIPVKKTATKGNAAYSRKDGTARRCVGSIERSSPYALW